MSLSPTVEAAAMRQTEDAFRELVMVSQNIGLSKESIALLLRTLADEISPPLVVTETKTIQ